MAESRRWEWVKPGDGDFHANFHRELPSGVTLANPTARLERRPSDDPNEWELVTGEATLAATVVDALKRQGQTVIGEAGGASRGVRVVITADPDPQPDVTDPPVPGDNYRVMIVASRSDSARPFARSVDLSILG